MRNLIVAGLLGCAVSTLSYAQRDSGWVKGLLCNTEIDDCMIIDQSIETDFQDIMTGNPTINAAGNKGKGMARFLEVVSYTTGEAIGALTGMMDGIRSTVHGAGYNTFKGELKGPSGTITFDYNFEDGTWNVSNKGSGNVSAKTGHL